MKKIVTIVCAIVMFLTLTMMTSAVTKFDVNNTDYLKLVGNAGSCFGVDGDTVWARDIDPSKNAQLCRAVYNAGIKLAGGFTVTIDNIDWDETSNNGVLIYISPEINGGIETDIRTDDLILFADKSGKVFLMGYTYSPNWKYGQWIPVCVEKAGAFSAGATSFAFSMKPNSTMSVYNLYVNDTIIYTYTKGSFSTIYGASDGRFPESGSFFGKLIEEEFNFSFQIWSETPDAGFSNGVISVPPTGSSLSYRVKSIEIDDCPYCKSGSDNTVIVNKVEPTATTTGYSGDEVCKYCGRVCSKGQILPEKGYVANIDITWSDFRFNYSKEWSDESGKYEIKWTPVKNSILINNRSDYSINAEFSFTKKNAKDSINGHFEENSEEVSAISIDKNTQRTVNLVMSGTLNDFKGTKKIGSVTIQLNGPKGEEMAGEIKYLQISGYDIRNYVIVNNSVATPVAMAASKLQSCIQSATGVTLPIVGNANRKPAIILDAVSDATDEESFTISTCNEGLVISGSDKRGCLYGAYYFLEEYLGWKFLPKNSDALLADEFVNIDNLDFAYTPVFEFRDVNWASMYNNWEYTAQRMINSSIYHENEVNFGGHYGFTGNFIHTFTDLMGTPKDRQPTLFTDKTYESLLTGVRAILAEHPDAQIISVSQNDNNNFAESDRNPDFGAYGKGNLTDVLLFTVNRVAEAIAVDYPNVKIHTIAYADTQTPPLIVQPRDNVIVQLCTINCCFNHALNDPTCARNAKFMEDFRKWAEICDNLYIWDYTTDFVSYFSAFPNFDVIAKNMKLFKDMGVKGVYEQGNSYNNIGEFGELRAYLLAKLMVKPDMSDDEYNKTINDFLKGYYGSGWQYIRNYLDYLTYNSNSIPNYHFGIYARAEGLYDVNGFISNLSTIDGWFDAAEHATASEPTALQHIQECRLGYTYLKWYFNYDNIPSYDYTAKNAANDECEALFNALAAAHCRVMDVRNELEYYRSTATGKEKVNPRSSPKTWDPHRDTIDIPVNGLVD